MTPAPHSILFDVGANNGAWAASYLRQHARARAYLFEPNRRFDAELALLASKYGAVHVRAAAWIEDGNRTFTYSRNEEANMVAELLRDFDQAKEKRGLNFTTAGSINNGSRLSGMRLLMSAIQRYCRFD